MKSLRFTPLWFWRLRRSFETTMYERLLVTQYVKFLGIFFKVDYALFDVQFIFIYVMLNAFLFTKA